MQTEQAAFRALADPTRRAILRQLTGGDLTIAQVADDYAMTRAAVKKHLTVLSDGGLISITPAGRERINRLNPEGFRAATSWFDFFDSFWDGALNDLKTAVEKENK